MGADVSEDGFDPYYRWLGIPESEQPPNHYRLLGISLFEQEPDVIESAADQRMAFLRSVASGKHSRESQRLLNQVAEAKLCLLDPDRRMAYNFRLQARLAAANKLVRAADPAAEQSLATRIPAIAIAPAWGRSVAPIAPIAPAIPVARPAATASVSAAGSPIGSATSSPGSIESNCSIESNIDSLRSPAMRRIMRRRGGKSALLSLMFQAFFWSVIAGVVAGGAYLMHLYLTASRQPEIESEQIENKRERP